MLFTKKNKEIIFLYSILLLTIALGMTSNNFMTIWFSMELNLIAFVPILLGMKSPLETESTIKYFLIQSISSSLFLFSCIMTSLSNKTQLTTYFIMIFSIMAKLGAAPFHTWFPSVLSKISWKNLFFSSILQKVMPLFIVLMMSMTKLSLIFLVSMNMVMGTLSGLSQFCLKKILAFSSISHMAWIVSSIKMNFMIFCLYFTFYTLIMMELTLFFDKMSFNFLADMSTKINSSTLSIIIMSKMFSLAGLPPFMGFYPKMMCIFVMMKEKMIWMPLIMTFLGMISIFIYMRTTLSFMVMGYSTYKNMKISYSLKKTSWFFLIYTEVMTVFLSILLFLMYTY